MTKNVEQFLKDLLAICNYSVESSLYRFVPHFLIGLFGNLMSSFLSFSCIFGNQSSVQCGIGNDLFLLSRQLLCHSDYVLCLTEASQFQEVPFINYCS